MSLILKVFSHQKGALDFLNKLKEAGCESVKIQVKTSRAFWIGREIYAELSSGKFSYKWIYGGYGSGDVEAHKKDFGNLVQGFCQRYGLEPILSF